MRDINRTFPEHPFFGSAGGQTSLFRLLKAYSLQDMEAGYCQVRLKKVAGCFFGERASISAFLKLTAFRIWRLAIVRRV